MMMILGRFFCLAALLLSFSCGNRREVKLSIKDKFAGVKLLAKVPQSKDLFFLFNVNNYNQYTSGSFHAYSRSDFSKKITPSIETPSFASTVNIVKNKYLVASFESLSKEEPAQIGVWSYTFEVNDAGEEVLSVDSKGLFFSVKRSSESGLSVKNLEEGAVPVSSLLSKTSEGDRLVLSCSKGELFVMDLSSDDSSAWKAPVHVRNYGTTSARTSLVATKDNFLLLFPSFPFLTDTAGFEITRGYDKKEELKNGAPKTESNKVNSLKERLSRYQLAVYDLAKDLEFKELKEVYKEESFWLFFDLDKQKVDPSKNERFFRTNFLKAKPADEENVFYLSQRSAIRNESSRHQILKLTVSDLSDFRKYVLSEQEKPVDDRESFDFMSQLDFGSKPLFQIDDEKDGSLLEDSKRYSFYDFAFFKSDDDKLNFCALSYNYRSKHYFLLAGQSDKVKVLYEARKTKESYWGLLLWDMDYVTVKNSYKESAELISGNISL